MAERTVHHGRNIKRIREIQGIKQEALALELGDDWNQKKISLLEAKEKVDDHILEQVAKALNISKEAIENFNEEAAYNIIGNTYNDNAASVYNNFNPLSELMKVIEENRKLYERLLQAEKEKIELFERLLAGKN